MRMFDGVFEANGVVWGSKDSYAKVVPFKVGIDRLILKVVLHEKYPTGIRDVSSAQIVEHDVEEVEIVNNTRREYLFVKEHSFQDTVESLVEHKFMRDVTTFKDVFHTLFLRAELLPDTESMLKHARHTKTAQFTK